MTTNQRTKTMTTFHPQQFDCGQCAHQKAGTGALQISVTNCTNKLRGSAHEAGKSSATIFKEQCKSTSLNLNFRHRKLYPLSKQGFYGSPIACRKLRGVPRDGHAMAAKCPAGQPAKTLASCPRNVPAMAGQWQRQCRRMAGRMTRKTTCLAPYLDAPCPRRKLARRLASNLNHDIQQL
jgi:hypothetical protein